MVGQRRKILELYWTKHPISPTTTTFGPENKRFKTSYLEFITFRFSGSKSQKKSTKTNKKDHSFYSFTQKTSLILLTSTHSIL